MSAAERFRLYDLQDEGPDEGRFHLQMLDARGRRVRAVDITEDEWRFEAKRRRLFAMLRAYRRNLRERSARAVKRRPSQRGLFSATLAILLFAALPAGGQELTTEQRKVVGSLESAARSAGLGSTGWRGERWQSPAPCVRITDWRGWLEQWYREAPAGERYVAWERKVEPGRFHNTSTYLHVASAAEHSAMLRPYVACKPPDVRFLQLIPEADSARVATAWAKASGLTPPPQAGCNLGGWSPEPVSRETCDEILPVSRMTGPGADACCHKDSGPSFFPPRPASRTCVDRPGCFLGGEPPADPEEPPVDPPTDPPVDPVDPEPPVEPPATSCDLAEVEASLETLQATLAELLQRLEAQDAVLDNLRARQQELDRRAVMRHREVMIACGVAP